MVISGKLTSPPTLGWVWVENGLQRHHITQWKKILVKRLMMVMMEALPNNDSIPSECNCYIDRFRNRRNILTSVVFSPFIVAAKNLQHSFVHTNKRLAEG